MCSPKAWAEGTKEYSKAKESEDMEEERESNIKEKIRMMRKQAGKSAQRRKGNENSAPERRKTKEMITNTK